MNKNRVTQKRAIAAFRPMPGGILQPKCACGQHMGYGHKCAECKKKRLSLQHYAVNHPGPTDMPPIVHEVLRSPGQPLDDATRAFMEPHFGHDFSQVRVHTDVKAAESAQAVNALAYTVGRNVVFGKGYYVPGSSAGQRLLAHELTHVLQQQSGTVGLQHHSNLAISPAKDQYEHEADRIAELVAAGNFLTHPFFSSVSNRFQRACGPREIGSVGGCIGLGGQDITDVGVSSEDLYRFEVGCDTFKAGEEARLRSFAGTIAENEIVEIHGFASEEGGPTFNDNLSCARAYAAANVLAHEGVLATTTLFQHGATPGLREERRSVVLTFGTAPSSPKPEQEPEVSPSTVPSPPVGPACTPIYDTSYIPSSTNCALYHSSSVRPWLTWTYRHNATCACENTPDNPENNCVRKCLQVKLNSYLSRLNRGGAVIGSCIDPIGLFDPLCPEPFCSDLYDQHVDCYNACCCDEEFINYAAFLTMCEAPFPCSFVGGTIDWFNRCL